MGYITYPGGDGGNKSDHRDELDVAVDLLQRRPELAGHIGALQHLVELTPALLLLAARPDELVRSEQRVVQLLQRPPRLGRLPPQLRDLQLTEQAAHDLDVLSELPAQIPVAASRVRRLHDHGNQAERVNTGHLHHARCLTQPVPGRGRRHV